jgi:hypothetical protein
MADQHASLTEERWATFSREQQLLMMANEMYRATKSLELDERPSLRLCYERLLRLADLTAAVAAGLTFRRELLRWRDLVAELYLAEAPDLLLHRAALKALLGFSPAAWAQLPYLLPS